MYRRIHIGRLVVWKKDDHKNGPNGRDLPIAFGPVDEKTLAPAHPFPVAPAASLLRFRAATARLRTLTMHSSGARTLISDRRSNYTTG